MGCVQRPRQPKGQQRRRNCVFVASPFKHVQLWIRIHLHSAQPLTCMAVSGLIRLELCCPKNHQPGMSNLPAEASALTFSAYRLRPDGAFDSTELTRGPWDAGHQHAGPPIALAARSLVAAAQALGMQHVARLTASVWRPIPIATLKLETATDYAGRNVAHLSARLMSGDRELARFTALAQREAEVRVPRKLAGHPPPQAPATPEASPGIEFPHRTGVTGYHDLVEMRTAEGTLLRGPCAIWFRLRYTLVEGEAPGALERVAVAADSGNGISAVLDLRNYTFVNSDLTINLLRPAQGEWICIDARTFIGPAGGGLAEARIFDVTGLIGRSTQSLLVRPR